jgi:hypothetical protein
MVAPAIPRRHRYSPTVQANMMMKKLLTVTAVVEVGAGVALLGVPSVTASLLFGAALESTAAVSLARVGGAAILALSIVCWLTRDAQDPGARALVRAMVFYNFAVGWVLVFASFGDGLHGMLLWPALAFHAVMGAWCVMTLSRSHNEALP